MNSSGPLPREKTRVKEIAIGITKVLKLSVARPFIILFITHSTRPDLTDHERWEPSHIMSPIDSAGRDCKFFYPFVN
jgi:hypothetical protein